MAIDLSAAGRDLQATFMELSASNAADHLLSPYVPALLLNAATSEPGTPMWIVNRSDVYDMTLQKLFEHPLPEISSRAREKFNSRHSSLHFLSPPEDHGPLEQIVDHDVEEVLGHPLASFEAMLYFSQSPNEDHRASAALSLTRRLLEHPPNWSLNEDLKKHITENFLKVLLEDASQFVRSYAARIPLFSSEHLSEALSRESVDFVLGRLLQNQALTPVQLELFVERLAPNWERFPFSFAVCFLDGRLNEELRKFFESKELPPLQRQILQFQHWLKKL